MMDEMMEKVRVDKEVRLQKVLALMETGVVVEDPERVYVRGKLVCG